MTQEVNEAISQIADAYGESNIQVDEDGQGGAYVVVNNIFLGHEFYPSVIWCGFYITFAYPVADVYPHFINNDLNRGDGRPFSTALQRNQIWRERTAIQISRRSNNLNPAVDTALVKLEKIIKFIKES